jgi:hypothetical protein
MIRKNLIHNQRIRERLGKIAKRELLSNFWD